MCVGLLLCCMQGIGCFTVGTHGLFYKVPGISVVNMMLCLVLLSNARRYSD